jgi:hypothetical protein
MRNPKLVSILQSNHKDVIIGNYDRNGNQKPMTRIDHDRIEKGMKVVAQILGLMNAACVSLAAKHKDNIQAIINLSPPDRRAEFEQFFKMLNGFALRVDDLREVMQENDMTARHMHEVENFITAVRNKFYKADQNQTFIKEEYIKEGYYKAVSKTKNRYGYPTDEKEVVIVKKNQHYSAIIPYPFLTYPIKEFCEKYELYLIK